MPNRILREGILHSARMAKLGWPDEVFYRRLHSVVDDFGRYYADPGLLHAACYPRQLNKVTDADIGKWLTSCVNAGLVSVYPAQDGERYLELLDFGQQIRAKKSRFPNPLSTCVADAQQMPADAHLGVSVSVSVSESVVGIADADKPSRAKAKTRIPDDFEPDDTGKRLCVDAGFSCVEELMKFRNHHEAKGTTMANWQAGWRTWIDKAKSFRKPWDQSARSVTVPGTTARDPALVKLDEDAKRTTTIPPHIRAKLDDALKGKVH